MINAINHFDFINVKIQQTPMFLDLKKHKNWRIKLLTNDKKAYEGNLLSADKDGNIVMDDTEEFYKDGRRFLGVVAFKGNHIFSIEIICKPPKNTNKLNILSI